MTKDLITALFVIAVLGMAFGFWYYEYKGNGTHAGKANEPMVERGIRSFIKKIRRGFKQVK